MRQWLPSSRGSRLKWGAVLLIGVLALSVRTLQRFRFQSPEQLAVEEFHVTSGADAGPGSLREGIFAADRAKRRARIVIDVAEILITTPLPPLINPHGVVVDAARSRARILATGLPGLGRVLDVAAQNTTLAGLRIAGAADEAIVIRASGVRLQDIWVEKSRVAVYVADTATDVWVSRSTFQDNGIGIQVPPYGEGIIIQNNDFTGHERAAIWAVSAPRPHAQSLGLVVVQNRFMKDVRSVFIANGNSRVERNTIEGARESAISITGAAAIVQSNRLRSGFGFGIEATNVASAAIMDNEVDHNCAGGILIGRSRNVNVRGNRLYANGSGVVIVYSDPVSLTVIDDNFISGHMQDAVHVIGGSPVLRNNRMLRNLRAALRISTVLEKGRRTRTPEPRLEANVVSDNGMNEPQHDDFSATGEGSFPTLTDCSWRMGTPKEQLFAGVQR